MAQWQGTGSSSQRYPGFCVEIKDTWTTEVCTGGCPAVVAQWHDTGGSRLGVLLAAASLFAFLYFCLITSKLLYSQHEARCSEQCDYGCDGTIIVDSYSGLSHIVQTI